MTNRMVLLALVSLALVALLAGCGGSNSGSGGLVTPLGYVGKIAFDRTISGQRDIFIMTAAGSNQVNLTKGVGKHNTVPSFSPNGAQIVFESDRKSVSDLYIMQSEGSGVKRLTFDGAVKTSPHWSPDGKLIAYQRLSSSPTQFDLWTIKPDGTQATNRTKTAAFERGASWGPDSKTLFFNTDLWGLPDLARLTFGDPQWTRLTSSGEWNAGPMLSPDGTKLLFASNRSGAWHVYRMGSGGNPATVVQLTTGGDFNWNAVYVLGGTRIVFESNRKDNHFQIFSMKNDGTDMRRLTTTATLTDDRDPAWNNGG